MARRGNGEDWIKEVKPGVWRGKASFGFDAAGKRIRPTFTGKSKKDVQDQIREAKNDAAKNGARRSDKIKVGDYLKEWLSQIKSTVRPATYDFYEVHVRTLITPHIGNLLLEKLKAHDILWLYTELEKPQPAGKGKDGKPKTKVPSGRKRKAVHQTLRRALSYAVTVQKRIPFSPCAGIPSPKHDPKTIAFWEPADVTKFLTAVQGNEYYPMFVVALDTGARQGELFALRWSDFNEKKGTLLIERSLNEVTMTATKDTMFEYGPTKSGKPRTVNLSQASITALREYKKRLMATGRLNQELIFQSLTSSKYIESRWFLRKVWYPSIRKAGVKRIRFHDMRHTAATQMLAAGIPIHVVSERLGHSNVRITLEIYAHVMPSQQEAAAQVMDVLLGVQVG